jgi:hypothetical protein
MKIGVWMTPCGVVNVPRRAVPVGVTSSDCSENENTPRV